MISAITSLNAFLGSPSFFFAYRTWVIQILDLLFAVLQRQIFFLEVLFGAFISLLIIHSSVDGDLHCFRVLAIVNSAAVNLGVHVSFSIMVFSGYMPSSGIKKLWHVYKNGVSLHL